jgi:hypothetical protein
MASKEDAYVRDIRNDLRERLLLLNGRYGDVMRDYDAQREALEAAHRATIEMIERERLAVRQLLEIEERREGSTSVEIEPIRRRVPLADFLIAKACAHGPVEREVLKSEAQAAGYEFDGRTFHATLMNVEKHGKVIKREDGRYEGPKRSEDGLFGLGNETEARAVN